MPACGQRRSSSNVECTMDVEAMGPIAPIPDVLKEGPKPEEATAKDFYFDSFSHFGMHETMLKDVNRTRYVN